MSIVITHERAWHGIARRTCQTTSFPQWSTMRLLPTDNFRSPTRHREDCLYQASVAVHDVWSSCVQAIKAVTQQWTHKRGCTGKIAPKTRLSLTSCPRLRLDNPCLPGLRFQLHLESRFPLRLWSSRWCLNKVSSHWTRRWRPMPPHIHKPSWSWFRHKTVWGSNSGCSPAVHRSRPYRRTPPQGSRPDRLPERTSRIQRWAVCGSPTSLRTRTTSRTCSGAAHFAVRASSPSPGASAPPGPRWYLSWYPPWWLLSPTKIRCGLWCF